MIWVVFHCVFSYFIAGKGTIIMKETVWDAKLTIYKGFNVWQDILE